MVSAESSSSKEEKTIVSGLVFGTVAMLMTRWRRQASSSEDLLRNDTSGIIDTDDDISAATSAYIGGGGGGDDRHDGYYTDEDEKFVQAIPKIELHVHLDGSFDPIQLWDHLQSNPELIMCLPVSKHLPWNDKDEPPLRLRDMIQDCQTSNDYRKLCTCRRRYRSLRQSSSTKKFQEMDGNAAGGATKNTSTSTTNTHSIVAAMMRKREKPKGTLQDMLTCFEFFLPLVYNNFSLLESLAYDFVKRQYEQNVVYSEVRYSPHYFAEDAYQAHAAVTLGLRRGCKEFNSVGQNGDKGGGEFVVNQILCAINFNPEWSTEILQMAKKFQNDSPCAVVGIDVASGEDHFNVDSPLRQGHFDMCQQAQESNINVTIHAGETPSSAQNVVTAIEQYGAKRIGHAYRITDHPEILDIVRSRNIHLEVCPTSSVETGGWEKTTWMNHPANTFQEWKISQSLSSDDPAVFNTSLTWQYRIAIKKMGWSKHDLAQMTHDAVDASFLSIEEKHRLKHRLQRWYDSYKIKKTSHIQHSTKYNDRVHYE